MCGIFAYLTKNLNIDINLLKNNGMKCQHRGPDNTKDILFNFDEWKLYYMFHRLAINGLSTAGDQPININNKSIICNGEIYNYKYLADKYNIKLSIGCSDCEILIKLYEKIGINFIKELDGVFSFILFDFMTKELIIGHDPVGVRSLYWFKNTESFGIASELKCLSDLNENIKMFPPGTYCIYDLEKNMMEIEQYYNFIYPTLDTSEDILIDNIKNKLTKAVDKRLMSDKPVGCLLSGGLDSSIITALTKKK